MEIILLLSLVVKHFFGPFNPINVKYLFLKVIQGVF